MSRYAWMAFGLALLACEDTPATRGEASNEGDTNSSGNNDNDNQYTDEQGCASILRAIIRDFPASHPDFHHEGTSTATVGMVMPDLGPDGKPVSANGALMWSSRLHEWYETIPGVNQEFATELRLHEASAGTWVYDNSAFFPLSPTMGYGADIPGQSENFLFTTELSLEFVYEPGQKFKFRGDDDLWVFIAGKLAIDLGGIHSPVEGEVDLQLFSNMNGLGFVEGRRYPMHIFHAERNPTQSNFRIETTIGCFNMTVVK